MKIQLRCKMDDRNMLETSKMSDGSTVIDVLHAGGWSETVLSKEDAIILGKALVGDDEV